MRALRIVAFLALAALFAEPLGAQDPDSPVPPPCGCEGSLFDRLNLDRLRLRSVGAAVGAVKPAQTRATSLYALQADYGEIARGVHVAFTATYWGSRFTSQTTERFAEALRTAITDTTEDYELDVGRINVSDISLGVDFRWFPLRNATLRPYAGGGVAAHVINAEGRIIRDTFVERALDNITAGIAALGGVDLHLGSRLSLGAQARFDLVSGMRFGAVRLGGSYMFDTSKDQVTGAAP